jgi:hypothetical protein
MEQLDNKLTKLKEDLVNTKEQLNRTQLDKDVLEQEKSEACECCYCTHSL